MRVCARTGIEPLEPAPVEPQVVLPAHALAVDAALVGTVPACGDVMHSWSPGPAGRWGQGGVGREAGEGGWGVGRQG
eukprot:1306040-Prymnesium_polylepis.1